MWTGVHISPYKSPQKVNCRADFKGIRGNNGFAGYPQGPKNSRKDQIFGLKVFVGRKKFVSSKKRHALFCVKDRMTGHFTNFTLKIH